MDYVAQTACGNGAPGRDRLSGMVEVDETYIGGKRSGEKRGCGTPGKISVVIAVQEEAGRKGRIRLFRVSDTSANSFAQAVQACIEPGSVVRTMVLTIMGFRTALYIPMSLPVKSLTLEIISCQW